MRRAAGWSALVVLAALTAAPAHAAGHEVDVGSYYFEDDSPGDGQVVIDAGDQITFTFYEGIEHTATVNGLFDSGRHWGRQTYTTSRLTRAGTYTLYCTVHGAGTMSTRLVIRAGATTAPTATRSPTHRPSPTATRRPSPAPTAARTSAPPPPSSPAAVPTATPATPSTSPLPSPTPSGSPRPAAGRPASGRSAAAAPVTSSSASPPTATPPDVARAEPLDGSGSSPLLPIGIVVLLLLLGAGAIALGRRRAT